MSKFYSMLGIVIFISLILLGCEESAPPASLQHVKLGIAQQPLGVLIFTALEQKFFEKYGLDVEIEMYPSGKRALDDGLFAGKADVITSAETPVALSALSHSQLRVIASLSSLNDINHICARRDLGVNQASDLAGKTIGVQLNSSTHYFFSQFLQAQGINEKNVQPVDIKVEDFVSVLESGKIAAFSSREPYISFCQMQLGARSIVFSLNRLYEQRELLITTHQFSDENPAIILALLKALLDAEHYVHEQSQNEIVALAATQLDIPFASLRSIFEQSLIRVELPQSLLLLLEDEFRWQAKRDVKQAKMPNFNHLLLVEPLKSIAPERVTVIK